MKHDEKLIQFGERLKELRIAKGLTQLHLADSIGSSESTISRAEKGKHNPTLLWMYRISEALEIDPSDLISLQRKAL
jgi:transcriptional regulator with XRE-family HTH domain